jgi:hypothetical protein
LLQPPSSNCCVVLPCLAWLSINCTVQLDFHARRHSLSLSLWPLSPYDCMIDLALDLILCFYGAVWLQRREWWCEKTR